ncbi:hypothetical protein ScalyP_jg8749 [Parmales sp. scaly parma]|nr:hypothetical protein ScalyP_jg8749 [Parmales sp. scaly parma]
MVELPETYFPRSPLSKQQKEKYLGMAENWLRPLVDNVTETEKDGWTLCSNVDNVKISKKGSINNPVVMIRGQSIIKNYSVSRALAAQKSVTTTAALRKTFRLNDPMNIDSMILHNIHKGETPHDETQPLANILWAAFKTPPIIWSRDFVWLLYTHKVYDKFGREACVVACQSIETGDCPDLQASHKYVRGEICRTGYVYTQIENTNDILLTYLVQVNPKGAIPKWVVNVVAADQGENARRVRDNTHGVINVVDRFNTYIERIGGKKIHEVGLPDVLVYNGKSVTVPFLCESNGILVVQIYPQFGETIDMNGINYTVDKDSDVAPVYELSVRKNEIINLVFSNQKSGYKLGSRLLHTHIFYSPSVRPSPAVASPTATLMSTINNNKKKKRTLFQKMTGSGKKKHFAEMLAAAETTTSSTTTKYVDKKITEFIHLEKEDATRAERRGILEGAILTLMLVLFFGKAVLARIEPWKIF